MSVDLSAAHLLVATPAYAGVSPNYLLSTHRLRSKLNAVGLRGQFVTAPGMPVDAARDQIGNGFLQSQKQSTPFTHLLMVDSDIGFEPDVVMRMIARDVDFAAAVPPLRRFDFASAEKARAKLGDGRTVEQLAAQFAVKLLDGKLSVDNQGFARVDQVGGAFLLLRPRVFETIRDTYPDLNHREGTGFFLPAVIDGQRLGEDIAFCRRWRKTGGDISLLVDAPFTHDGPFTFKGNYRDLTTL